ncbi:MAG TPA: M36 family metallopeptidase [Anaerolineae bacterium]|nr:M36 family metallopeptidase [Anaerolineae bacterium]
MNRKKQHTWLMTSLSMLLLLILVSIAPQSSASAAPNDEAPTRQYVYNSFLTGPNQGEPLAIAKGYLTTHAADFGLTAADVADMKVTNETVSSLSGVTYIYGQQLVAGIGVYGAHVTISITDDGRIVAINEQFVPNAAEAVVSNATQLTAFDAVEVAALYLGLQLSEKTSILQAGQGAEQATLFNSGGISLHDIPAKLVYQQVKDRLVLAWDIEIYDLSEKHYWSMRIDAATGDVLDIRDLVIHEDYQAQREAAHGHGSATGFAPVAAPAEAPAAAGGTGETYQVYAWPVESPNHTTPLPPADARTSQIDAYLDGGSASPFGWHDTNGVAGPEFTITQGNNVHAYDDGDNPGYSPDCGASLNCDFPLDLSQPSPEAYEDAAIVNLFYWNNIIHDVMYQYGFDPAGGNFQDNLYGEGGVGGDSVNAEAQDGGGTCNANFLTLPDGSEPRMQMYVCDWDNDGVTLDGDFDNMVIVHEYAHGISIRLTGGPANTSCLNNSEQAGEGWSDWYGLMFTMDAGDTRTDARGVGTYLFNEPPDGGGIRSAPYSTDFAVNDFTYGDIGGQAIPHGVGFVWATIVWEMTWDLIDEYGFDADLYNGAGGNNMAMSLVTEGLKQQVCNPGFVDSRDGILAADQVLYGGANQCLIWDAFARRGLGWSAVQGSSSSTTDGTEAFDIPAFCEFLSVQPPAQDLCVGDTALFEVLAGPAYTPPVDFSTANVPAGVATMFDPTSVGTVPMTTTLWVTNTAGAAGMYTFDIIGTDSVTATGTTADLHLFDAAPGAPTLVAPADTATDQPLRPMFSWSAPAQAGSYMIEVDDDPAFGSIDYSATVEGTMHESTLAFAPETTYYWRVRAMNACGTGVDSATFSFTTGAVICFTPNLPIVDNQTVTDEVTLATGGLLLDLDVSLDVSHTWVSDLTIDLEHVDTGTMVNVYDSSGCSGDDIAALLDDDATNPVMDACAGATPTVDGTFYPPEPLANFNFESLAGTWRLHVTDSAGGDQGTLNEWCLLPADVDGVGTVTGQVTDGDTGMPLAGADVAATGPLAMATMTDASGMYTMTLMPGDYDMTASMMNYVSATVTGVTIVTDTVTTQDFALYGSHLSYSPAGIEEFMSLGDVVTNTVTVTNTGPLPIDWSVAIGNFADPAFNVTNVDIQPLAQQQIMLTTAGSELSAAGSAAGMMSDVPHVSAGTIALSVDDGSLEDSIGLTAGGSFLWMNRFTPDPNNYPFTLQEVWVLFNAGVGVDIGEEIDIYIYEDTDGDNDPGTNAVHLGSYNATVQAADATTWSMYTLAEPVVFMTPGDVLIGVVNRTAGVNAGEFPAAIDQSSSQGRSWVGSYTTTPSDPPTLPSDDLWGVIDSFGLPGNWTVRGAGVLGAAAAWASAPVNSGTVPANSTATFEVVFDSNGLLTLGTYTADLTFSGTFVNMVETMPLTMHLDCPTCGVLDGSITDRVSALPVVADVMIDNPGVFSATVTGDTYNVAVPAGTYSITVMAPGYLPAEASAVATAGMTTTTDFALWPQGYISLEKTVSTDGSCGTTNTLTVNTGTPVYYCYTVTNTGSVSLTVHDLMDDQLGTLLTGAAVTLDPAASYEHIEGPITLAGTTTNVATWDAYNPGAQYAQATASATVIVIPNTCNSPALSIPDNSPGGASNSMTMTGGSIQDLNIWIDATHTWVGDLSFTITHEDTGTSATVIDRPGYTGSGFGCAGDDISAILDDSAATPVENECADATPTIDGIFLPNEALAVFNGESLDGTWTITVSDGAAGDTGTLDLWCIDAVASGNAEIEIDPTSMYQMQPPDMVTTQALTITNLGDGDLTWTIDEWQMMAPLAAAPEMMGSRDGRADTSVAPVADNLSGALTEGFDDVTNLPGWATQNNSDTPGTTDWFQGSDGVFPAQAGDPTAYIGANFNNTAGTQISNWLMTPELTFEAGSTFSFWTRTATGSSWPDRLQVRVSTAGASTDVGTAVADVGDFTNLELDINDTLSVGGYPEVWTQYTIDLSAYAGNTGRVAMRYYVPTSAGPTGNNSNYIGIDSVEFVGTPPPPMPCEAPADIPWASVAPTAGTTISMTSDMVDVTFDSTGLAAGIYTGTLCIRANDADEALSMVPLTLEVVNPLPELDLQVTVGTDPASCATTDMITVDAGTEVTYCYSVANTGNMMLYTHTISETAFGHITTFDFELWPGDTEFVLVQQVINETTVSDASWFAITGAEWAEGFDTTTVEITGPTDVALSNVNGETASSSMPLVMVFVLVTMAAGFVMVSRRRQTQ